MTTPAGWYDDGSGRQRWWDGQQWTEHFAPEAAATPEPAEPAASEAAAAETPAAESTGDSLDDTVIRPANDTSAAAADAQPIAPYGALNDAAATTPIGANEVPPYAAEQAHPAPTYPGAAPTYPGAAPAYAATTPPGYGQPGGVAYPATDSGPKKVSVLGLVGLGLAVLGTILACVPVIGFIGFILLGVGFIVSIVSLFLKGKKWPGIVGLSVAIVGSIIGVVVSILYFTFALAGTVDQIEDFPTSTSSEPVSPDEEESAEPDDSASGAGRPTAEEVTEGLTAIIASTGVEGYTEAHLACFGEEFVASDIDDDTLWIIASGEDTFEDIDAATAFTEEFSNALPTCML